MVTFDSIELKVAAQPRERVATDEHAAGFLPRPKVRGKFLFAGKEKLWIKGVTYGTFRPDDDDMQFPAPAIVEADFGAMQANGFNTIRTYTVPPRWLLDVAERHGLRVMVGLPWTQHVAFIGDETLEANAIERVRSGVKACAGHAAVLCYTLGNEIPPSIVRWHGKRKIEAFLKRLYAAAKREDRDGLFTYVNFPTTEYLSLPFLDLVCFNVYLETEETLERYLARLQNLAGDKPLMMAEIGLDSRRNGEVAQAQSLSWQVRTAFEAGCAGAFVFSWTDEWYRGGHDIEDWDFGLTTRERKPKPALSAVRRAFAEVPFRTDLDWPKVSVVVCSFNGSRTIRDTLDGLLGLAYPSYEVIVVNDGSTDATPAIAAEYPFKLISTENRGLSNARNTGWQEASGEIVAYIDDDAYPDPHWLHYLAYTFMTTDYVGVGGPNIAPPGDGPIADCVANAPGGPVHVLVGDTEAEHIPGCNMAFRRQALAAIDGFDPRYRAAGDDVDLCWRLQERGWKIGFNAAAMDWHHRRNSVRMYWRQQQGYGKAEALLEQKWPAKYNALGHVSWSGRLYGKGLTEALRARKGRIYQGQWGLAPFQSIYEPAPSLLASLILMPEWFLMIPLLGVVALLGLSWPPLLWAAPLFALAVALPLAQAVLSAAKAEFPTQRNGTARIALLALTAALHIVQPIARLKGRLDHGLTLWRSRVRAGRTWKWAQAHQLWSDRWRSADSWLRQIARSAEDQGAVVQRGGDFDSWDLELGGGAWGSARLQLAIEDHGSGRQVLRVKCWRRVPLAMVVVIGSALAVAGAAAADGATVAAVSIAGVTLGVALVALRHAGHALSAASATVAKCDQQSQEAVNLAAEELAGAGTPE